MAVLSIVGEPCQAISEARESLLDKVARVFRYWFAMD